MSIRYRIILLVALVFCALAAVGGYAVYQASSNSAQVRTVTDQVVPSTIQSVELMTRLKDVQIAALAMVSAPDPEATRLALHELNARKGGLEAMLTQQQADADSVAQRGLIREAQDSLLNYFASINDTAQYKLAGNQAMAEAVMGATVDQYLREQGQMIEAVQVEKRRSKDAAIAALQQRLRDTTLALSAISVVAVLGLGVIGLLLYRQVVHPIAEMEGKMTEIATSQDFTHRLTVSRRDEIGRSMVAFNTMVGKIQESSLLVRQKAADIHAMLQYIPQGIMTVQAGGKVHPEHSDYLRTILETDEIAGRDAMALVFSNTDLGEDTLSQADAAMQACIGEDEMNFEFNAHLLPAEVRRTLDDGRTKVLDLGWSPIVDEQGTIVRLMLCIRDVTELRALAEAAGLQKRELEIIGQILAVRHEKYQAFEHSARELLADCERLVAEASARPPQARENAIGLLFRNMHTIKGNARTYGLRHLAEVVHGVEQTFDTLRRAPAMWVREALDADLHAVRAVLDEYGQVSSAKLGRSGPGRRGDAEKYLLVDRQDVQAMLAALEDAETATPAHLLSSATGVRRLLMRAGTESIDDILQGVTESLPALAHGLGKEPPRMVIVDHGITLRSQVAGVLRNAFMHLIRNAVDHGIEAPLARMARGKPAAGRIALTVELDARALRLRLEDDGQGLVLDRVRARAVEQGLVQADEVLDAQATAELIFAPGFSTADRVTDVSGRGVGMDAVRGFIEAEGGTVAIRLHEALAAPGGGPGRRFEIVVSLPAHLGLGNVADLAVLA